MNKLGLLLCFLLIVNISAEEESDMVGRAYDIIINLLKGMSEEGKCSRIFEKKKSDILPIVKELVEKVKTGKSLSEVVVEQGFKLLAIEDLAVDCKAFSLFELFSKITSKDGIKDIGLSIQQHADKIHQYVSQIKTTQGISNKIEIAGKMFALIFNFKVY